MTTIEGDVPTTWDEVLKHKGLWDEVFQHKRFKELNDAKKQAEDALATFKAENEQMKSELATLKAGQTDLEKLNTNLQKLQSEFEAAQQQLAQKDTELLRSRIAAEAGIPDMADLLIGNDEEAMRATAERLTARLRPTTPGVPPANNRTPAPTITEAQMNDPKWVRENPEKVLEAERAANK